MQGIKIKMIVCCSAMFVLSASGAEGKQKVARKKSQESMVMKVLLDSTPLPQELCGLVFSYNNGICKIKEIPIPRVIADANSYTALSKTTIAAYSDYSIWVVDVLTGEWFEKDSRDISTIKILVKASKNIFASGHLDGDIRIRNNRTGKLLRTLEGPAEAICALAKFSKKKIVSGSWDGSIKLWNYETGQCLKTLCRDFSYIYALEKLSKNRLAVGDYSGDVNILDCGTGESLKTIHDRAGAVVSLVKLTKHTFAVVLEGVSTIKICNHKTGMRLKVLEEASGGPVHSLIRLSETLLIAGYSLGFMCLWNHETGTCLQKFDDAGSHCVRLSPDRFVSLNQDMMTVWEHPFKARYRKKRKS